MWIYIFVVIKNIKGSIELFSKEYPAVDLDFSEFYCIFKSALLIEYWCNYFCIKSISLKQL